ncbi:MAG: hypothetical protein ACP5SI_07990 [Chloroflexia bacterium]
MDESGPVEKLRRLHCGYRIRVQNLHTDPTPLTIFDQVPASCDKN